MYKGLKTENMKIRGSKLKTINNFLGYFPLKVRYSRKGKTHKMYCGFITVYERYASKMVQVRQIIRESKVFFRFQKR